MKDNTIATIKNIVEAKRNNVSVDEFFNYVKKQANKKGLDISVDRDEFENPGNPRSIEYKVKNGVKYSAYSDYKEDDTGHQYCVASRFEEKVSEWDNKAEILRSFPYNFQCYISFHDGTVYNEIMEFAFDTEKRGHGYYFLINTSK
jgi:hypothetical protein